MSNDKIGFSIDGILPFKKVNQKQINMSENKQYKSVKFNSTRKRVAVKFEATELKEGEELKILDEAGEVIPEWTGEITIDTGEGNPIVVSVDESEIISVDGEAGADVKDAIDENAKLEDADTNTQPQPTPQVDLTPIVDAISELKEMVSEILKKEIVEDTAVEMSAVKTNDISRILLKSKK